MERHVCTDCKKEKAVQDHSQAPECEQYSHTELLEVPASHSTQTVTQLLPPGRKRCPAETSEVDRGPPPEDLHPRSPSKAKVSRASSSENGLDTSGFRGSLSSRDSLLSVPKARTQLPTTLVVSDRPPHHTKSDNRSSDPEVGVKKTSSDSLSKMDFRWPMVTFLTFILVSLVLYLAELALHIVVTVYVFYHGYTIWFIVMVVMLCAPSILVQVASFLWGIGTTECVSHFFVGFLHVLQLSVPWRYLRLICSSHVTKVDHELLEVGRLRLLQCSTSSIPILIFEVFIIIIESQSSSSPRPELLAAAVVSWVSISWVLATTCKREKDYSYMGAILSWPNTCLKLIWRLGEVGVRVLLLALCVALQTYWIFMVLGLHWVTMFSWLLLESSVRSETKLTANSVTVAMLTAYIYLFSYRNISDTTPLKYKPILFYCIMFFENTVLLVLWILYDNSVGSHLPISIATGIVYVMALAAMVSYYNCFHMKVPTSFRPEHDTAYIQTCVNCKIGCCVKNNIKMEQPFSSHWWMEVKSKSGNTTSDYSDTMAPSDFSSVSKTLAAENMEMRRLPPSGGHPRHNRGFRPYMDDTFSSTLYTDSQYMSEYTVDSYYDTGSEIVYNYRRRAHAPDLIEQGAEDGNPNNLIHQRSDSGFSASVSLTDSKYSKQNTDFCTTDDSDVSHDPQKIHERMIARWRKQILQNPSGDASESDFFSQSSVASYPSSMLSRKALYYANRDKQIHLARVHGNGVARRIDRSKPTGPLGPLGLPINRHRRHRGAVNGAFILDDKLEQIIKDVCDIEMTLKKEKQDTVHHNQRHERYSDSDSTYIGSGRSYSQERSHTSRPHRSEMPDRRALTPDAIIDAALRYWARPRTPDRLSVSSTMGVRSVRSVDSQSTCSHQRDSEACEVSPPPHKEKRVKEPKLSSPSKGIKERVLNSSVLETSVDPVPSETVAATKSVPQGQTPEPQQPRLPEVCECESKEHRNVHNTNELSHSTVNKTNTKSQSTDSGSALDAKSLSPGKLSRSNSRSSIEMLQTAPLPQMSHDSLSQQLPKAVWF